MSTKPEGFAPLTPAQIAQEAAHARVSDAGRPNVTSADWGYMVYEEPKRRYDSINASIQVVRYSARDGGMASLATETYGIMKAEGAKEATLLAGMSDGRVILKTIHDGKLFSKDVTEQAAAAGITAAGIRRTQHDIAADGEVDRAEQQAIINLIAKVKAAPSRS